MDKNIDRELTNHIDLLAEEFEGRGLTAAEARRAAHLTLGNTTSIKEAIYEMKPAHVLDAFVRDAQLAMRSIRLNPKYSITLVLILAVCLGANMAVFSIVYSVLLRPLPIEDADQIVVMVNRYPKAGAGEPGLSSAGDYYDRMKSVPALQDQAMFSYAFQILESGPAAERIPGMTATPSLFKLLRVNAALGRTFSDAEGEPGANPVMILSDGLWRNQFAADPGIAGKQIRMGGRSFTVIGVMPEKFQFGDPGVRFWAPLAINADQRQSRHANNWWNIGRLRPGATISQVQAQLNALNAANLETAGALRELLINVGFETKAEFLKDYWTRDAKPALRLLWGAALLVLLIGALNTAGMVAARTSVRRREMGTRLALGASLGRLAVQIVSENLVLALAAGVIGLGFAHGLASSLTSVGLDRFPRATEVSIDAITTAYGMAASIAAGLVIAAFSIAHLANLSVSGALADYSRSTTAGRRAGLIRKALVTAQVALAFVLLMGAGVLLASFRELLHLRPGFDTQGVLTATTLAPSARYAGGPELNVLLTRSLAAIRSIPGVVSAGATNTIPLQSTFNDIVIFPEGYVARTGESMVSPLRVASSQGYFETMGIRLLSGRYFDARDTTSSLPVVIIDKQLATKFWPGQDAVGRRMFQPSGGDWTKSDANTRWLTVAGVVDSVRMKNLAGTDNEAGAYYFPSTQSTPRTFSFVLKTSGDPASLIPALRAAIGKVDPVLALFDVQTMAQRTSSSLASRRAALTLTLAFGAISLLLASVGLYSVLSYLFAQRRREIAVRMAIGCTPAQAFALFLREGAMLTGAGIGIGVVAAFFSRNVADKFAYGVKPFDPVVVALVASTLAAVAFLATALPARQAARVDPAAALAEQ